MTWRFSFFNFPDTLLAFTCSKPTGNLWSTCLGVKILRCEAKSEPSSFPREFLNENNPLLKRLRACSQAP